MDYEAVLLDIEGTITPISFVYDTLFPYAHDHVGRFLKEHWYEPDVHENVDALRRQADADRAQGLTRLEIPDWKNASDEAIRKAALDYVHFLSHDDRKATALKTLQGKVWREGYERGQLRGEFYDDALRAMARWHAQGIPIAIFSSGSVEAQQLLFRHSQEGDLTDMIAAWFDTTTGPKREPTSYEAIAMEMEVDPRDVLFATDVAPEAAAASAAGMQVVLIERLGNPPQPSHVFRAESDFELV